MELQWNANSPTDHSDPSLLKAFQDKLVAFQACDQKSPATDDFERLLKKSATQDENICIGKDLAVLFMQWRGGDGVPLPFLLNASAGHFDIDPDHPLMQAAVSACILGEIEHENPYHNNHHFREVFATAMLLCARHNALYADDKLRLKEEDILLLASASAIHDLSHDGGDMIENEKITSRLEIQAVNHAAPFLLCNGMGDNHVQLLRAMIVATDVIPDNGGHSPADMAREIYHAHMRNEPMPARAPDIMLPLIMSRKSALLARFLGEADIIPSSGTDYTMAKELTIQVAAENDELRPSASTLYTFLDVICHRGYDTQAAQDMFGQNFDELLKKVRNDAAQGVLYS